MTKDELKKEAEELIQRFEIANSMNCYMQLTPDRKQIGEMLVMIAEPREKRIKELEKENAELKEKNRQLNNEVEDLNAYCNQIGKIKTDVLKLFEHIVAR